MFNNDHQWKLILSQPRQQCQVYAYCGSYGICNDKSQPFCQCPPHGFTPWSRKDWDLKDYSGTNKFLPLTNVKLPDSSVVLGVKSLGSCGSACLGNCSCMGYAHEESSDQCLIWSEEHVLNLQQLEGNNGEGSTGSSYGKSNKAMIFTAVVLGSLGVMIISF
ncbi:hypothetical protein Bca52824_071583 [Brassica carinata]|uniref:Apple domain-containing protein n=1 Tax=Brassica carinata TaxID=52824 RepID=A0A8X7QBH6_BRACI|nr:hypothetical protein Bca52824_071583 [Brassica carinata]